MGSKIREWKWMTTNQVVTLRTPIVGSLKTIQMV